jgi:hypothetical protein
VRKSTGSYPRVRVDGVGKGVVSHAGGLLLTEVVRVSGVDRSLTAGLAPWRKPLAITIGQGCYGSGDRFGVGWGLPGRHRVVACRAGVFGLVASDPTVSHH